MTAKRLIAALAVLDENILAEAARMAKLFGKAAEYRVDKMRIRMQADAALEICDAKLTLMYRARGSGKGKTEAYFKARTTLHPRHRRLATAKETALQREELAKLILDAYRMRRDAIKIIADHRPYAGMREEAMLEQGDQRRRLHKRASSLESRRKHIGAR